MIPLRSLRRAPTRLWPSAIRRAYSTPLKEAPVSVSKTNEAAAAAATTATTASTDARDAAALAETTADAAAEMRAMQAPNRRGTWTRSQQVRETAMTGPRFEQMVMEDQPRPYAAIELIHKQPVSWREERVVSCDGGGGPLGHPRIFINLDKPEITECTYCGLPFANEHHRKHIESLPSTPYPLEPIVDAVQESRIK